MNKIVAAALTLALGTGLAAGAAAPSHAAPLADETASTQGWTYYSTWTIKNDTGASLDMLNITDHGHGEAILDEWNRGEGKAPSTSIDAGAFTALSMVDWFATIEYVQVTYSTADGYITLRLHDDPSAVYGGMQIIRAEGLTATLSDVRNSGLMPGNSSATVTISATH